MNPLHAWAASVEAGGGGGLGGGGLNGGELVPDVEGSSDQPIRRRPVCCVGGAESRLQARDLF